MINTENLYITSIDGVALRDLNYNHMNKPVCLDQACMGPSCYGENQPFLLACIISEATRFDKIKNVIKSLISSFQRGDYQSYLVVDILAIARDWGDLNRWVGIPDSLPTEYKDWPSNLHECYYCRGF